MKFLVTGGCGFIGSNLAKELVSQGWVVDIVDDMSNGHIVLLDGVNIRRLPNSYFLIAPGPVQVSDIAASYAKQAWKQYTHIKKKRNR